MFTLSLALTATSLLLLVLNLSHPNVHIFDYWAEYTVTAVSGSTVGAVLASQRPHNPIGWIFCIGGGLGAGIEHFGAQYATYALLAEPGSLPGGAAAAWLTSWMWTFSVGLFVFLCLLFPYGRLPSSRWRWFAWLSGIVILTGAVLIAFQPGQIEGLGSISNPLGLKGANIVPGTDNDFLVQALLGGLGLVATASLFVRLRRARGVEHLQLQWFTYATMVLASGVALAYTVYEIVGIPLIFWGGFVLVIAGLICVPIAVGVAVMHYRLYNIDVVINRTLVYGSLTAFLAAGYFGSILLLQGIGGLVFQVPFRALTGQESQLANVAATLAMAALFNPLRRRIQSFIDRSFYRRKYDAAKTLEAFAAKLRDETDLDALSDDLTSVVKETMQPAHVSLWLRPVRGSGAHPTPHPGGGRIPHRTQDAVPYLAVGEGQGTGGRQDSDAEAKAGKQED
jgi:hypothetical protein